MLTTLTKLTGTDAAANDGELGTVDDVLFDDGGWTIRYVKVQIGPEPTERHVLLSPYIFGRPDWQAGLLRADVTRDQALESPEIEEDRPVSRQEEERLHTHYGWQPYWNDAPPPSTGADPYVPSGDEMTGDRQDESVPSDDLPEGDPHLRSGREVLDYFLEANGARVGKVADFVLDDETWVIRYVIVDTGEENDGKQVVLASHLIDDVDFDSFTVFADVDAELVQKGPEFDPTMPINEEYEEELQDYFGY